MDSKNATLTIKLNDLNILSSIANDELLNVSLLEITISNKSENISLNKKLVVQFLKEKNLYYKNLI